VASIKIPASFNEVLSKDPALKGGVEISLQTFSSLLEHPTPSFFPEYTDHGINHLESVLKTASSLITDDSCNALITNLRIDESTRQYMCVSQVNQNLQGECLFCPDKTGQEKGIWRMSRVRHELLSCLKKWQVWG